MENLKKAYLAGGCFWGMEDLFRVRPGVKDTEVGYIGGSNENPTYQNHPKHAEGLEISFFYAYTTGPASLDVAGSGLVPALPCRNSITGQCFSC